MNNHSPESLPKTFFRISILFVLGFIIPYLIYCLLDTAINHGLSLYEGNSIWSRLIDPAILALGMGAVFIGFKENRRKAIYTGFAVFLTCFLFFRLWMWFLSPNVQMALDPNISYFFIVSHETIAGLITGTMIGYSLGGRKNIKWYAIAGAIGFTLGFLITDAAGRLILALSPSGGDIHQLIVGSSWFYLYFIIPALLEGIALGIFLSLARIVSSKGKRTSELVS